MNIKKNAFDGTNITEQICYWNAATKELKAENNHIKEIIWAAKYHNRFVLKDFLNPSPLE